MLDRINLNDELNNSQLNEQIGVNGVITNPANNTYKNINKNLLIDETAISDEAVNLYQKDQDIKKFNSLAMSDPQDLSHEDIVSALFNKGVSDVLSEETVKELSNNEKLLKDLNV